MFVDYKKLVQTDPCELCGADAESNHSKGCNILRLAKAKCQDELINDNGKPWYTNSFKEKDNLIARLVEALRFYANPENFLWIKQYGVLEYGDRNIHLTEIKDMGFKAKEALTEAEKAGFK